MKKSTLLLLIFTCSLLASVTSRAYNTSLTAKALDCLVITEQPSAKVICSTVGATASMSVGTSIPATSYAWQYRVVTTANPNPTWISISSVDVAVYSNYTSATLGITRTATLPAAGTQYRVVMATDCGTVTSESAGITIVSTTKGGTIATASTNVCLGNAITFTLTGYSGTSLQWQSAATATGVFTSIVGATGASYTVTNAQLTTKKSYRVLVTNSCNATTAFSTVKTITVNPPTVAGTVIGGGPICSGTATRMSIVGHTGKVQWQYSTDGVHYVNAPKAADGQTVPFSTTSVNSAIASYMISNLTTNVYFRAKVVSGACDVLYPEPVQYVLYTEASVGTVTPSNSSVCEDSATTLNLSSALGAITWEKSLNYLDVTPTWTPISSSNVLAYHTQTMMYDTAFRAKVTIGSCSTKYSNLAYVHVIKKAMVNTITKNTTTPSGANSASAMCTTDFSKVLSISTESSNSIQWQWSTSSVTTSYTDIVGATNATYTVTNGVAGANYYRVKLTNTCGRESVGSPTIVYYKDCVATKLRDDVFGVVAYPNPSSHAFSLHLSTASEATITVLVYDVMGKQIEKRDLTPAIANEALFGAQYPAGIYQIVVSQDAEVRTLKVVKQ